ncbi:hypothetical protein E6P09_17650 (plasmid) [Haloferax mediterranei ATCC 33500]|uniref:ABC-2 type transport system permease protein n=1 Tax=Haloferax mediterranei (strain ATCC 33500 / DSM 1411 / JCM 8866 / NBRC 14739 / NCIMB 2177 / R-4) TaxID=523841 RepID=I3R9S4_HALMT|nr:hypothetical protein [Haloferax mediterranei]AFK20984.1 hypothetical protein HFX_5150 [Haloferax mediterranei ATCC 33500]AHZ24152.1 hypothetical protein BM92_18280 [Haloferax mediterranei ATCC 33500]EMA05229.1 hypothetical protein C439_00480 [Haloferax mediterranei ATCC 33500]MDX5989967.1 hypothetical protein [Haloferax mediterranei ATCC 33500]QCQ77154.1 hypothetical protein E6P09_17650 [Haloferax mediterranei ATCC 33500]
MSLRQDVRHGARIGRAEFVRSLRGYTKEARRIIGIGFALLFFGGMLLSSLPAVYLAGRTARSMAEIPYFGVATTAVPVALLALAMLRTFERIGSVEAEDFVLTAVHPRAVVIGLLTAEVGRLSLWFGLPIAAIVTTFTLGLGTPTLLLTAAAVVIPLTCWATVWGYALGIAVLRVLRRLPGVRRVLKAGGVILMLAFILGSQFAGKYIVSESASVESLLSGLAFGPLVDYVSLAFVGTPLARPISGSAVVIILAIVVLTPVGLAASTRQATALWFTDVSTRSEPRQTNVSTGGFSAPKPFSLLKSGRVAWGFLVRSIRHPQKLTHLVMILFFLGPLGSSIFQSPGDALGPLIAGTGVGFGTYLAGATFGLNPIGDDRPHLPLLLLTETTSQTIVRGRAIAGLALGIPVAVLVPLGSIALGTTSVYGLTFALVGIGMCLAAAAFAVGLGSAYPVYEARKFWGAETVVPSTLVMMLYLFVVGSGTVIGLVTTWYSVTGHLEVTALLGGLIGLYLLLTVGASYGSYRYAIHRYRSYTLD